MSAGAKNKHLKGLAGAIHQGADPDEITGSTWRTWCDLFIRYENKICDLSCALEQASYL